jgi:hypothetical protein
MVQIHEIDMRTKEQLQEAEKKEFIDKLQKLQDECGMDLIPTLEYLTNGIFLKVLVKKRPPKEEAKKE